MERQREQRQRQRTEQEWKVAVSLQPSYPAWCPRSILRSSAGQVAVKAGRGRLRSTQHGTSIEILARERRRRRVGGRFLLMVAWRQISVSSQEPCRCSYPSI